MIKSLWFLVGFLILSSTGCKKENDSSNSKVEFYLIESFNKVGSSYQIDEKSVVTQKTPLVYYSDILSYDSVEYIFELSEQAIEKIKNLEHSVHGLAFAIKSNNTLVYTGYFWPGYSSAGCDWVVIDPLMLGVGNKVHVQLGYPGLIQGTTIPDKRNDERIIQLFKQDNKLN